MVPQTLLSLPGLYLVLYFLSATISVTKALNLKNNNGYTHLSLTTHSESKESGLTSTIAASSTTNSTNTKNINPKLFLGILSGPKEHHRRDLFRKSCIPSLLPFIKTNLIRYAFFIGVPEEINVNIEDLGHEQGHQYSEELKVIVNDMIAENLKNDDIKFVATGDHYQTTLRKVLDIFRVGTENSRDRDMEVDSKLTDSNGIWNPDYIIKSDIDGCFDYRGFKKIIGKYYESVPENDDDNHINNYLENTDVGLMYRYRPSSSSVESVLQSANLTTDYTPYFNNNNNNKNFLRIDHNKAQNVDLVKSITKSLLNVQSNSKGPKSSIYPILATHWFKYPNIEKQKGFSNYTVFEPYPKGPCYVIPREIAYEFAFNRHLIAGGGSVALLPELVSGSSEDMTIGYFLSGMMIMMMDSDGFSKKVNNFQGFDFVTSPDILDEMKNSNPEALSLRSTRMGDVVLWVRDNVDEGFEMGSL